MTRQGGSKRPELLAPAGQAESFYAALENGADAVYLGLKQLNARASAHNFSLSDLSVLIPYAHKNSVGVYVTVNSTVAAGDIPLLLDLLQSLCDLKADALIVQDPAIFHLAGKFFPELVLHASTLMAIHNHSGAEEVKRLGARRVVLARELSFQEIRDISLRTDIDLEIFVHGALCYSYSGLCLASSFRGGRSGLRGRCVQPCRLRFRQGRTDGFHLSCNDLCALPLIPELKRLRLASFKIEGRMKPPEYVAQVVAAYRLVLDSPPETEKQAVAQAQEWLSEAPSRRLTTGFLIPRGKSEVLSPHRSGASGLWVGTVERTEKDRLLIELRRELNLEDRLRPESSAGREEQAFSVTEICSLDGSFLAAAGARQKVYITRRTLLQPGDRLFLVGKKNRSYADIRQKMCSRSFERYAYREKFQSTGEIVEAGEKRRISLPDETVLLKIGRFEHLVEALKTPARWVLLSASRRNLELLAKRNLKSIQKSRFGWALPALIMEKDLPYYRAAVSWYAQKGFSNWEINNWGHLSFFPAPEQQNLIAGYRFNVRNIASLAALARSGCNLCVLSLEITREELEILAKGPWSAVPIVTVFSWPPLFTSRLIPKIAEGKPFYSQRGEGYLWYRLGEHATVYADHPVDWLEVIPVLRNYGFKGFLVDLSEGVPEKLPDLQTVLKGFRETKGLKNSSLFNFNRFP